MRKAFSLFAVISVFGLLLGCATSKSLDGFKGGGSGGGNTGGTTFKAGNWAFNTNGGINGTIYLGGYLASTGSTVSGNLFVLGNTGSGFLIGKAATAMPVTGTVSNGSLTLTGTLSSSSFTITLNNVTGTSTALTGTYSVTGGTDNGDNGTINAVMAGSFDGNWAGTDVTSGGTVTFGMTEATTPNADGSFTISPSTGAGVVFAGVPGCVVAGTLNATYSFAAGGILFLDVNTIDQGIAGEMQFVGVASDATNPTTISSGVYQYSGGSSCFLQSGTSTVSFTMAKQ